MAGVLLRARAHAMPTTTQPKKILAIVAPAVVVLGTLLASQRADAAEIHVERGNGAEACPDPSTLEARARESVKTSSRDVAIRFARTSNGYASSIRTSDGMIRALEDARCDALADATLVIVRLALDVESPAPAASAAPSPTPANEPVSASSSDRVDAPVRERESENGAHSTGVELLAGGAAAAGLGVSIGKGARLGAAWLFDRRRWSIGVTGLALAPETRTFEKGEVEVGVLGGGLEGCGRAATTSGAIAGALCARGEIFRLSGSASGFARNDEHARPLAAMGLVLRGKMRIARPFGLFAELAASVPLARERFSIDGAGVVYEPPIVAGTAAAGLSVDFE
jgi:hypothetical protein